MKTYVINLDKYINHFNKQKPVLESVGLDVERFPGINAIENEHLKYKKHIYKSAILFTPKSTIGCSLSHILLAQHILKYPPIQEGDKSCVLIMEDDAYPLEKEPAIFQEKLKTAIDNIHILDSKWDIIQLHSDFVFPSNKTYSAHPLCGSTAAYLISYRGLIKLANLKTISHIDMHTSFSLNFKKYRIKENLFWTDEKHSINRIDRKNFFIKFKHNILTRFIPLRGEKTWENFLSFKLLRVPVIGKEFTPDQLMNYLIGYFIVKKLLYKKLK